MKKIEKVNILNKIKDIVKRYKYIFCIDISKLNSTILLDLKKSCYYNNIKLNNFKNTLLKKVLNNKIHKILLGPTFLMYSNNMGSIINIIKKNQININNIQYPIFKGALIESIEFLSNKYTLKDLGRIKPKNETILKIIKILTEKIVLSLLKFKLYRNNIMLNIIKGLTNKN